MQLKWIGDLGLLTEATDQLLQEGAHIKHRSVMRLPKTGQCQVNLVLRMRKKEHESAALDRLQADVRFDEVGWT